MDTSERILVAILSVALAVFLVLAIVIAIQILRLLKVINRITAKADHILQTAEHVGEAFSNASSKAMGSMAVFRVIRNVVDLVTKDKSKSKKGR